MDYGHLIAKKLYMDDLPAHDGRFFIKVLCEDDNLYQVKFDVRENRSNQNELIMNYVASEISASVPDGVFIQFSERQLKGISEKVKSLNDKSIVSLDHFPNMVLFGSMWYGEAMQARSDDEVESFYNNCKNREDFFCVFPCDQYLRNYDRQHFNHIAVKKLGDKKPSHYVMIDGDRIFGSTSWNMIDKEKTKFSCFDKNFHKKLYSLVNDTNFKYVKEVAAKISYIDIELLMELLYRIYDNSKENYSKIRGFLEYRKDKIWYVCNGDCFENVSDKPLSFNNTDEVKNVSTV